MLSSGTNVIICDKMLSSGANVIMVSSGANVIIWWYHVMLSSGMITHPFFIFPENFTHSLLFSLFTYLGWYSAMGFHIGKDRNFVCLWRRHNCRSQVIDLSLSVLFFWFIKSIIGFLNNSNLQAVTPTSLIINLQWVKIIYFAVLEEIFNNVVPHWSTF